MNKVVLYFIIIALFTSCNEPKNTKMVPEKLQWEFKETINLSSATHPISVAIEHNTIWLSDPSNNRILKIDRKGNVLDSIAGLQRPMNILFFEGKLYIPEYLADRVLVISDGIKDSLVLTNQLNAPASIDISSSQIAIADFYNHRVILKKKDYETTFGEEGSNQGQFHYPTDVKLYQNEIYVADAYNNRVLIFDLEGNEQQVITEKINYPTDVILSGNELWVANFKTNYISIFTKK